MLLLNYQYDNFIKKEGVDVDRETVLEILRAMKDGAYLGRFSAEQVKEAADYLIKLMIENDT